MYRENTWKLQFWPKGYSVTYIFLLSVVQHLSLHPLQKPQLPLATPSVCISALIHFSTFARPGLLFVWSMTYLDASLQPKKRVSRLHSWDQCQTSFLKNNIDFFCTKRQEYIKAMLSFPFLLLMASDVLRQKPWQKDMKKTVRYKPKYSLEESDAYAFERALISSAFTHGQIVNECSIKSNDAEVSGLGPVSRKSR